MVSRIAKIRERLRLLYHNGYIERIREHQISNQGSRPFIYAIENKGIKLLRSYNKIPPSASKTDWTEKNRRFSSSLFLRHSLLISEIMIAVEMGCGKSPGIRFISPEEILKNASSNVQNQHKPFKWQTKIRYKTKDYTLGIEPDKVFGLHFKNRPAGRDKIYFFLEADRGTMAISRKHTYQTSIYKKLHTYFETHKQKLHKDLYNINNFRVLFVTTASERAHNMLKANKSLNDNKGSRLFLFTDKSALGDNIFTATWINGMGERVRLDE